MPKTQINLLPQEDFEKSPLGKFLIWALNVGRWIVIFTELVVILAFLSRFKLDQDLSDLYDSIREKQKAVEYSATFEQNFRITQRRILDIQLLEGRQLKTDQIMAEVVRITPQDITYQSLAFGDNNIFVTAVALSETGLSQFFSNLLASNMFKDINIGAISKGAGGEPGIHFSISFRVQR